MHLSGGRVRVLPTVRVVLHHQSPVGPLDLLVGDRDREPERSEQLLVPGSDGIVTPEQRHEVEPRGPVRFYVEFLR